MPDGDPPAARADAPGVAIDPARRRRFKVAAALLPVALVAGVEVALRIAGCGGHAAMPLRFRDFCHPTERGYEVLAPVVAAAVER